MLINLIIPRKIYSYSPHYKILIPQESNQAFLPEGDFYILFFLLHNTVHSYKLLKNTIKRNIGVVCVCRELPKKAINSPNVTYIVVGKEWFNPLVIDKTPFKAIYTDFHWIEVSDYFKGLFLIYDTEDLNKVRKQYEAGKNNVVFDIDGGLGDNLLTIPTLKTYAQTKKVFVKTKYPEVFENLDYVNIHSGEPHNKLFYLNFGSFFSDYTRDLNKQNRIFAIANFCGLSEDDLVIKKPEIILTEKEKSKFKEYKYNIFLGITTARPEANLPLDIAQKIIDNTKPYTFVSASKEVICLKGINLFKDLTIRDLFSLIYQCSGYVGVDTSFLHIAGTFGKSITLLANGLIPHQWRTSTYDNVKVLEPKGLKCYPCVLGKFVERDKRLCEKTGRTECYYKIDLGFLNER